VGKPSGAPPGLVQLKGAVQTIKVDLKSEQQRLERLIATREPPISDDNPAQKK